MLWPGEDEDEFRTWSVELSRGHAGWMEPKKEQLYACVGYGLCNGRNVLGSVGH
jgi:hypothetical protein